MSNRTYDLVVLLDADAPTDTRTKIVTDAQALITQHGEVKATKAWGTRQLPYLIDHHEEAEYHVFQFETVPDSIAQLDRGLKLTEGVLRFRIFETEAGQTLPDAPPLFKAREDRGYERPPREAQTAGELSDTPAAAPAAPAAAEAAPAEAAPAEAVAAEAAVAETPAAEAPAAEAPVSEAPVSEAAAEAAPAEAAPEPVAEAPAEAEPAADTPAEAPAE